MLGVGCLVEFARRLRGLHASIALSTIQKLGESPQKAFRRAGRSTAAVMQVEDQALNIGRSSYLVASGYWIRQLHRLRCSSV